MLDLIDMDPPRDPALSDPEAWAQEVETQTQIGRFTIAMWLTVFILALLNSADLTNVVNGWGVGPVQDTVVSLADTWNSQMVKNKFDQPAILIREAIQHLHDVSWDAIGLGADVPHDAQSLRGTMPDQKQG